MNGQLTWIKKLTTLNSNPVGGAFGGVDMRLFFTILAFFVASCTGDENQQINAANVLPPVFTSGNSIEVLEGLTFTGYVAAATDPEGMQVVFSISGGADEGLFSIEATSGRLSFITQPDFEMPSDANLDNEYIVVISAFDGRFSRTITVSIKVSNRPDFADGALRIVGKQEFDGLSGFGTSSTQTMASAGDVDGDGLGDFLIGAPLRDIDHQEDVGAVYLLSGKAVSGLNTGSLFVSDIVQLDGIGIRIDGISEGDKAGFAVSSAGDVDGDGLGDVLIGAPGFKSNLCNKNIGAAYLIFGSQLTSGVSVIKLSDVESNPELGFVFYGSCDDAASAGRVVRGLGDLDSDGLSDFTIGSLRRPSTPPFCEDGLFNGLACGYVFFIGGAELKALASNVIDLATVGTAAGFGTLLTTDFVSASSSTPLGQYDDIAVLENLDGDSVPDVLIGSGFNRLKEEIGKLGAIHLVSGSDIVGGRPKSIDIGGGTSPGSNSGGEYGIAVASLGDIDGNDFSNFAVGFPGYGDVGAIGPARGSVDIFFPTAVRCPVRPVLLTMMIRTVVPVLVLILVPLET